MQSRVNVSDVRRALQGRPASQLTRAEMEASAVAIILRQTDEGAEVLLIVRASKPQDPWSGHVAFPGGRREAVDADDLATALRESKEEVGIDLATQATLLGTLDEVRASARGRPLNLLIVPFVFELSQPGPITLSDEVDAVFWAALGPLASGEANTTYRQGLEGHTSAYPAFRVKSRIVWGLTHRMLVSLLALLCPTHFEPAGAMNEQARESER